MNTTPAPLDAAKSVTPWLNWRFAVLVGAVLMAVALAVSRSGEKDAALAQGDLAQCKALYADDASVKRCMTDHFH